MTVVRSAVLLVARSTASALGGYTIVPGGYTWIVKSAIAHNFAAAAQQLNVYVTHSSGTPSVWLLEQQLGAGENAEWAGWMVLGPGDVLQWGAASADGYFWISGTKLLGVAPPSVQVPGNATFVSVQPA